MTQRDPLGILGLIVADKYRIERLVGEGGFALVYRAQHTIWNKPVAIKFFNQLSSAPAEQRAQFQEAFIQEGALLTELSSETAGIVQARDIGTYTTPDGSWMPFMVLEWLEGVTLDACLEQQRERGGPAWTLAQVLRLLGQAAAALDVAHGKGIAHRDIKPANLFVLGDPQSGRATLKVLDFGVAKMMSDNTELKAAMAKTGMNVTSFTPQYAAPEQFSRTYGATGPWTDVFALALVAVEMLLGRPALDGDDVMQLAFSSGHPDRRPTPQSLGVGLPDAVEAVFRRALAVDPRQRFHRAGEFWRALEAVTGSMTVTERGGSLPAIEATQLAPQGYATLQPTLPSAVRVEPAATGSPSTSTAPHIGPGRRAGKGAVLTFAGMAVVLAAAGYLFLGGSESSSKTPSDADAPAATQLTSAAAVASAAPAEPSCPERMAKIPAGQFFQGSDAKDARDNEKPAHNVSLSAYCLDLYEVAARDYKTCSGVGKCKRAATEVDWPKISAADKAAYSQLCTAEDPGKLDHPINCVTWEMASLYCKAQGKRLPTEAEWEYAARGPDGRVYPWGDAEPTAKHLNACGSECVAWGKQHNRPLEPLYALDDGYPTTAPVGKFEEGRSRFGPYDVVGNVWEWVADWDGQYGPEEKRDPTGPSTGARRVIRGGAWNGSFASWLRPSFRYAQDPAATSHGIGFRCAVSL